MKKIIYTDPATNILCVIIPAAKTDLEKVLGVLTNEQYEAHVIDRSLPKNAINPRAIDDKDLPLSREFRNAWCDVTDLSDVDIDCEKVKQIVLGKVRMKREELFKPLDQEFIYALEKGLDTTNIIDRKQVLRDSTESIKSLDTSGKINDTALLQQLSSLLPTE